MTIISLQIIWRTTAKQVENGITAERNSSIDNQIVKDRKSSAMVIWGTWCKHICRCRCLCSSNWQKGEERRLSSNSWRILFLAVMSLRKWHGSHAKVGWSLLNLRVEFRHFFKGRFGRLAKSWTCFVIDAEHDFEASVLVDERLSDWYFRLTSSERESAKILREKGSYQLQHRTT